VIILFDFFFFFFAFILLLFGDGLGPLLIVSER
jgi:hypothetical protein